MRRTARRLSVVVASCLLGLAAAGASYGFDSRRLIVAYAPAGSDALLRFEALVDARRCELIDREVDVYTVDVTEIDALGSSEASADSLVARLARYRGDGDVELVLVGKDGGVKARTDDPAALDEFLAMIDGMPMRRAEVRRRGGAEGDCDP